MNIYLKNQNKIQTPFKGHNEMDKTNLKEIQKNIVKKLYERARYEMTQEGEFEKIIEEFQNPKNNDIYTMEIAPCYADNMPQKRYLTLGYELNDGPNKLTFSIADGTKQDILDYLSNDYKLDEISAYYKMLENKANNM